MRIGIYTTLQLSIEGVSRFQIMMEFTCNSDKKCHSTRFTYITFPRYYLVCFAVAFLKLQLHLSLPRCYKFSPAVDMRWEHTANTRSCCNLMGPYFQAVLYLLEYGCHLARLSHHGAYAPKSNTASHDNHEKINSSFPFLSYMGMGLCLGPWLPELC